MLETIKQDGKNSFKKLDEKNNKKLEEMNKFLKDTQTFKQVMETAQDLKTEMEVIKKTKTERWQDMENWGKWTETTETSITNRIKEIEEWISETKDTIEEINTLIKENSKSNKFLTQNVQEIWDTMKRPNLRIVGVEEGEE